MTILFQIYGTLPYAYEFTIKKKKIEPKEGLVLMEIYM